MLNVVHPGVLLIFTRVIQSLESDMYILREIINQSKREISMVKFFKKSTLPLAIILTQISRPLLRTVIYIYFIKTSQVNFTQAEPLTKLNHLIMWNLIFLQNWMSLLYILIIQETSTYQKIKSYSLAMIKLILGQTYHLSFQCYICLLYTSPSPRDRG